MKRKKKTHKAAAKRLKVNAAGKIFRMRARRAQKERAKGDAQKCRACHGLTASRAGASIRSQPLKGRRAETRGVTPQHKDRI